MAAVKRRYPKDEFARRGEATFEKDVQPHLKGENKNHFLAIDIETGAYEVDADELTACHRLRDRLPEAQIWLRRVGSKYLHSFGGHPMKKKNAKPNKDDLRSEYDLAKLKGGVRGKYLARYRSGTNLALLEPDVRAAFPTDEAVNKALRSAMRG